MGKATDWVAKAHDWGYAGDVVEMATKLYAKHKSTYKCGPILNVDPNTFRNLLVKLGIPRGPAYAPKGNKNHHFNLLKHIPAPLLADGKEWNEKELLHHLITQMGHSPNRIAGLFGCSVTTIYKRLHKHDIPKQNSRNWVKKNESSALEN